MDMAVIVHGDLEHNNIRALDHRVDYLAVDKIDIRHAKEKRHVLSIGVFNVASDAPFGFFHGDNGVAEHDVIVHRIAMALVHETYMNAIEGVVDVVEVIANTPPPCDVQ